jgi:hypothetical protein
MKRELVICSTYKEAFDVCNYYSKPMYILNSEENKFLVVDLSQASKLIKKGYKIAEEVSEKEQVIERSEIYSLQNLDNMTYRIVKVLKEYGNLQEAADTLAKLLAGDIGELELSASE